MAGAAEYAAAAADAARTVPAATDIVSRDGLE